MSWGSYRSNIANHLVHFYAYGEPFADRFFFEIVQRRAYDAYGAVNAPARMAAQEQNANP